jgi:condensation domain-containing protein
VSVFPLAPEQRSMLFLEGLFGRGIFRNLTVSVPVGPHLPEPAVTAAVSLLQERQDALRSALVDGTAAGQRIGAADPQVHPYTAAPGEPVADLLDSRRRALLGLHQQRTTPGRARYELVRSATGRERHLLVTLDHLVADGTSEHIVTAELAPRLRQAGAERQAPVTAFRALCACRARAAAGADREVGYWKKALRAVQPLCGLMPHADRTDGLALGQVERRYPGPALHRQVVALGRASGVTPFYLVAALTAAAIWHRTGRRVFVLFTPLSNRQPPGFDGTIGCFVHDRPLVCRVDPAQPLGAFVKATMSGNWLGPRFAALSVPDLADGVPALAAALLTPAVDYVQLHVGVRETPARGPGTPSAVRRVPLGLGAFRPAHDLTVTTLRFGFAPDGTTTRAFFGGPDGGLALAEGLTGEVLALLAAAGDAADEAVGAFAGRVLG